MADQTTTIPKGWKMTTLGEVADIIMGQSPSGESYNQKNDGLPFYQGITEFGDKYVNIKTFTNAPTKIIEANSILFSVRAPVGKVNFTKHKACIGRGNAGLKMKNGQQNFLYFLLKKSEKAFLSNTTGTVFDSISGGQLREFEVLIPEREEEQCAIAAVLSSLDDKIELLREQNKTLEATAQAIFKEWFVNFNFPGATGKMIDSELGEIPEGWRVGGLIEDKISKFVKTNIDHFDGTKDYVETSNVNLSNFIGNFEKITFSDRPSRANMQPVANSIWFARMAESRKYLLFQNRDGNDIESKILSTGFAGIQSIKEYLYFYWCFILSDIFNDLKNQYAEGAVQVAISNGGIQRIQLPIPPIELAEKFTRAVGYCFEKVSNNNVQIQTLSKLRDTLLPKLMKGDIRVKGFKD